MKVSDIFIGILLAVLIGRFIPLLLVALILVIPVIIIQSAIKEGKFL